jgi:PST family polysaccharide transporter
MLLLLSALSVTRPVGWTIASYLQARQVPRQVMALELLKLFALLVAIATIGRAGPLWTCGAVGVAFALHTLASLWAVRRADGIPMASSLGALAPPLLACIPLLAAAVAMRLVLEAAGVAPLTALILETLAGAVAYLTAVWFVAREPVRELISRVSEALANRPTRPSLEGA